MRLQQGETDFLRAREVSRGRQSPHPSGGDALIPVEPVGLPRARCTKDRFCSWRVWGARKKSCSLKAKRKLQFSTFADFRKQVGAKKEVRVDHVGGKPEKTDVFRLRLKDDRKTAQEGSAQKRTYKTGGERVLLEARLRKVLKRPSRCKNVC